MQMGLNFLRFDLLECWMSIYFSIYSYLFSIKGNIIYGLFVQFHKSGICIAHFSFCFYGGSKKHCHVKFPQNCQLAQEHRPLAKSEDVEGPLLRKPFWTNKPLMFICGLSPLFLQSWPCLGLYFPFSFLFFVGRTIF